MTKNDDAKEWNDALSEGQDLLNNMRKTAIKQRDGVMRRIRIRMIRYLEKWIERGKRWRDDDLLDR